MIIQILSLHSLKMFVRGEGATLGGRMSSENPAFGIKQFYVKCLRVSSKSRSFVVVHVQCYVKLKKATKALATKSSFINCVIYLTSVHDAPCTEYISKRMQLKIRQSKGTTKPVI